MSDEMISFFMKLLAIVLYVALGALVSWLFYYLKRRDLLGGYIGGLVVGVIGALIGGSYWIACCSRSPSGCSASWSTIPG